MLVAESCEISVAFVYVTDVESVAEFCTFTVRVEVSARLLPNTNLCSISEVSTINLLVI